MTTNEAELDRLEGLYAILPQGKWEVEAFRIDDARDRHHEYELLTAEGRRMCDTINCDHRFCYISIEYGDGDAYAYNYSGKALLEFVAYMHETLLPLLAAARALPAEILAREEAERERDATRRATQAVKSDLRSAEARATAAEQRAAEAERERDSAVKRLEAHLSGRVEAEERAIEAHLRDALRQRVKALEEALAAETERCAQVAMDVGPYPECDHTAAAIREAATRLSAQPAEVEAVEGVARPTSLRALVDSLITFGRSHDGAVERDLYAAVERAEAALSTIPGGAKMRERAAKVCDAFVADMRHTADGMESLDGKTLCRGQQLGAAKLATAIRALPLSPEEEGRT